MALEIPQTLSPSRMEAFTSCPLAFRFTAIDHLPAPASIHAVKGSFVHRALELLYTLPAPRRTAEAAFAALAEAAAELPHDPEYVALGLTGEQHEALVAEARELVARYLSMEDPTQVHAIGLELRMEADLGTVRLRGVIDRLDLEDGELVVTDYKTGRPPRVNHEQARMSAVHAYALMCDRLLGRRPVAVRLLYLATGEVLEARPTDRHVRFHAQRTAAVHAAVARACTSGEFSPRPSRLCDWCAFQTWCPAFGGDPERARVEAPALLAVRARRVISEDGGSPAEAVGDHPAEAVGDDPAAPLAGPADPQDPGDPRPPAAEGADRFGPAVARFDDAFDAVLERVRGTPGVDGLFQAASHLGDFSLVWHLVAAARGLTSARRADEAFRLAALLGVESLVVNQGVKRLFRRARPTVTGDPRFPVRRPRTSSFPSGHASAAFFAAGLLTDGDRALAPLWYSMAAVVATSRAYVRIHHGSDVVAGAAVGLALAAAARRLWPS